MIKLSKSLHFELDISKIVSHYAHRPIDASVWILNLRIVRQMTFYINLYDKEDNTLYERINHVEYYKIL